MKNIISLLAIAATFTLNAQKIDFGSIQEADFRGYSPYVVGEDDKQIYAMDYRGDEIIVESFDKKRLRSKYRRTIELPELRRTIEELERLAFLNGNFVYFASLFNWKENSYKIQAHIVDAKRGRLEETIDLFSKETEKDRHKGYYDVYVSQNNRSVLVRTASYYKSLDKTIENLILFDSTLTQITEREYTTSGKYTAVSSNLRVDDEGSVYFIQSGDIVILDAFADYEEWREPLNLDQFESNASLKNIYTTFNPQQDLVLIGSYVTEDIEDTDENKDRKERKEGDTQVEGIFYLRLDGLKKEIVAQKLSKFDQDFIDQFKTEDHIKDGLDAEVNDNFSLYQFFFNEEDNSLVFVGEQYEGVNIYRDGNLIGQRRYYDDMVAFHFDVEGELNWAQKLPKNQQFYWLDFLLGLNFGSYGASWFYIPTETEEYFSYAGFFNKGKFCIVYNDDAKNIAKDYDHKEMKEMVKFKKSIPVMYTIDLKTGHKKREVSRNMQRGNLWMKPKKCYQKNSKSPLYILAAYKKDYRIMRVEL